MSERNPPRADRRLLAPLATALLLGAAGCQLWPFGAKERTSIITPSVRAASIREMGPRGRDADEAEQTRICEQLARQIQSEPDPIVRRAIQETIAEFQAPLADAVLLAGLNDDDRDVRLVCCRLLGQRGGDGAVAALAKTVGADADIDVRMAAVDALGEIKSPASVAGLAAALKDRDPALQYAGVEAMKKVSGEDLGNDVQAWRQYAARATGSTEAPVAVATRPDDAATSPAVR
jgi:HEAT repeat protein